MRPEEIARAYDALAAYWASGVVDPQNGLAAHEVALRFVAARGRALEVGCGSSGRILAWLQRVGFATEGLDISARMVELARAKNPAAMIHHGDVRMWNAPHAYDFISGWDSLWHVPLADHERVITRLVGMLNPRGVLIFSAGGVDHPDERTSPCAGQPLYHSTPGLPALLRFLAGGGLDLRHLEFDQLPSEHVFIVAQRRG